MANVKCVLLDIEGTVCPIFFVKDTLFPYAIKALPEVLSTKWNDADFQPYRDALPEQYRQDPSALQAHVEDLTKRDVKIAYLKNLQGYLWENGYQTGAYSTPLFPDVVPQLRQWKDSGYALAIYSSGSVFAQKLLFGHVQIRETRKKRGRAGGEAEDLAAAPPSKKRVGNDVQPEQETLVLDGIQEDVQTNAAAHKSRPENESDDTAGQSASESKVDGDVTNGGALTDDLTAWFDGWFDTTNAGLKSEASSYARIARVLEHNPEEVLFLSDNVKEVDAAVEAGMSAMLVDRPGNALVSEADKQRVKVVESLHDINLPERPAAATTQKSEGERRS